MIGIPSDSFVRSLSTSRCLLLGQFDDLPAGRRQRARLHLKRQHSRDIARALGEWSADAKAIFLSRVGCGGAGGGGSDAQEPTRPEWPTVR
jgi:hypothetical protein